MVSFSLKNHEGAWGGALVLHKLSSRSACIAWPTVQRDKWNVGQTPPLSFFLCLYPSLSTLTNTTALSIFRNVWCCLSAFVSSYKTIKLQKIKQQSGLCCEGRVPTYLAFINSRSREIVKMINKVKWTAIRI